MKKFLSLLVLFGGFIPAFAANQTNSIPRYNVLFIVSDDMRAELGSYGGLAKTPHLDQLAAGGVRFDRGYAQYPLCCPSRSSMLTGRSPATTGVLGNRTWFGDLHPDFISLPRWFKEHGYATARAGKIFHDGIDDVDAWGEGGEARYLAGAGSETNTSKRAVTRAANDGEARARHSDQTIVLPGNGEEDHDYRDASNAIKLLEKYKGQPFFIGFGLACPHSPPSAPQKFYDLYDPAKIPLPVNFAARPTVPEGFPAQSIRPKNADLFIGRDATPDAAREVIRAYLAACSYADDNIGRVLTALDKLGLSTNTIVVFWGDHGYELGERGKWSKAGSLFEEGARVPFIIRVPGIKGNGKASERVVASLDFYPTLVELCGLPRPGGLEGQSLLPLLKKPNATWDHPAFTVWSEDGKTLRGVTVRVEGWRYAEFEDGGAMLFDEKNDPHELKNVADEPKNAKLRAKLSKLVKDYWAQFKTGPAAKS